MGESNMPLCFRITNKGSKSRTNDHFMKNNRLLLERLNTCFDGRSNPIRILSEKEIIDATKNYARDHFLGNLSVYEWYKGCYKDRSVIIKLCKDWPNRTYWANEIAVLSQIKHKNVVELFGCCLETELPILVFQNCFHETLDQRIYRDMNSNGDSRDSRVLSWENKLRIATEIAYAITYLHNFTGRPIIYRDISAQNIILDPQGIAKLANFSLCFQLPIGKTDVEMETVVGTTSHLAPEYALKGRISTKTDVYRFGVVLLEILLCQKFISLDDDGKWLTLPDRVESLMRDGLLSQTVEPTIKEGEGKVIEQQLQKYVELATKCINAEDHERPEMKQVTKELWRIRKIHSSSP